MTMLVEYFVCSYMVKEKEIAYR